MISSVISVLFEVSYSTVGSYCIELIIDGFGFYYIFNCLVLRDGDPGCGNLESFSPTDGDWPHIMRVNPVLKWRYQVHKCAGIKFTYTRARSFKLLRSPGIDSGLSYRPAGWELIPRLFKRFINSGSDY
jgi:hypothetical protein